MTNDATKYSRYLFIFFFLNIIGFIYYVGFFYLNSYLPAPFVSNKFDTFMDLFNPMYWANNVGRYTTWHSVYPPINFLFLKLFSFLFNGQDEGLSSVIVRDASSSINFTLVLFYLIMPILVMRTSEWNILRKKQKVLVYIMVIISTPMLYALERGNLILIAPIFLSLSFFNSRMLKVLAIAILINIKPYFALLLIYFLVTNDLKTFVKCSLLAGGLFVISGMYLDSNFYLFFSNLLDFQQSSSVINVRELISLSTSISVLPEVFKNPDSANYIVALPGSFIYIMSHLVEMVKIISILTFIAIMFLRRDFLNPQEIIAGLVVLITNLGTSIGGYSYILYITLIPVFIRMNSGALMLFLLTIIFAPLDMIPLFSQYLGQQFSYLGGTYVDVTWTLGLGSILRPFLNYLLLLLMLRMYYLKSKLVHITKINEKTGFI